VEEHISAQEKIWNTTGDLTDNNIALLLDRLANKIGEHKIHRYLPAEHYWPVNSCHVDPAFLGVDPPGFQVKEERA
jgi:protein ImuB